MFRGKSFVQNMVKETNNSLTLCTVAALKSLSLTIDKKGNINKLTRRKKKKKKVAKIEDRQCSR